MQSTIIPLSEELRAAHRGAHYHVATPRSMPLRYEVHSTDLTQLMRKRFVQSAALITAHNPAGKQQAVAKNKKANAALQARIDALGLPWLPGHRKALKEGAPDEDGYFVLGISGGQLEALMVEFDQEVTLWCPASGTPVLMLHPLARRNYYAAEMAWERALRDAAKSEAKPTAPKAAKTKASAPPTSAPPSAPAKPVKRAKGSAVAEPAARAAEAVPDEPVKSVKPRAKGAGQSKPAAVPNPITPAEPVVFATLPANRFSRPRVKPVKG
jgi:hypothetical protein